MPMESLPDAMRRVDALVTAHPRLFAGRDKAYICHPRGWNAHVAGLVAQIDRELDDGLAALFVLRQVKEKFGALQVYYQLMAPGGTNVRGDHEPVVRRVDALISQARKRCEHSCQFCGYRGTMRNTGGWYRVTCQPCAEALLVRRARASSSHGEPQ